MKKQEFTKYTESEIETLRGGGAILHEILLNTKAVCTEGKTGKYVDDFAEKLILEKGASPVFKNYLPEGASSPYKYSVCLSVNSEVAHGLPTEKKVLKNGDLVSLDIGIRYKNLVTDSAISFVVGGDEFATAKTKNLIKSTEMALYAGIEQVRDSAYVNDIGKAIEKSVKGSGFTSIEYLCGHAVGKSVHEDPQIPHFDMGFKGERLEAGMVIAIEPHLSTGKTDIVLSKEDDWTYSMKDGSLAAQFEHTVLITKTGYEILT